MMTETTCRSAAESPLNQEFSQREWLLRCEDENGDPAVCSVRSGGGQITIQLENLEEEIVLDAQAIRAFQECWEAALARTAQDLTALAAQDRADRDSPDTVDAA
jgi:hypothetical protein